MKARVIFILSVLIVLAGALYVSGIKNGMQIGASNNPVHEYSTIKDLQNSVDFEFQVPSAVGNGRIKKICNYMNNIVEIDTDDINFRASEFIDYEVDLNGDYSDYSVDNEYENLEQDIWVRFRTEKDDIETEQKSTNDSVINMKIGNIAYTIKFYKPISENEAFNKIGINLKYLTKSNRLNSSNSDTKSVSNETTNTNDSTNSEEVDTDDIRYKEYSNENMKVSMMVPDIGDRLAIVENNNTLSFMVCSNTIFVIEYYEDGYSEEEFNGQTLVELDKTHLLRYFDKNPFEAGTQEYKDYEYLINGIDTLAMTFKATD